MANELGQMVVKIVAESKEFEKGVDDAKKKFDDFGASAEKIGGKLSKTVTLPLVALGAAFVKMADDAATAEANLANAIRQTGNSATVNIENLKKLANQMQSLTRFEDDAVISALGLTEQLTGISEDGLKQVTPAMLDFAQSMGLDLQSAASAIGKTIGTDTNALARYGIEVDASATKQQKLAQVVDQLNKKFGGAAEAAGKTGAGALVRLKNEAGNLAEDFGTLLFPAINNIVSGLSGFVKWLSSLDEGTKQTILTVAGLAAAAGPLLIIIGKMSQGVQALGGAFKLLAANPFILGIAGIVAGVVALGSALKSIADESERSRIDAQYSALAEKLGIANENMGQFRDNIKKVEEASLKSITSFSVSSTKLGGLFESWRDTSNFINGSGSALSKTLKGSEETVSMISRKSVDWLSVINDISKTSGVEASLVANILENSGKLTDEEKARLREVEAIRREKEKILNAEMSYEAQIAKTGAALANLEAAKQSGQFTDEEYMRRKRDLLQALISAEQESVLAGNKRYKQDLTETRKAIALLDKQIAKLDELNRKKNTPSAAPSAKAEEAKKEDDIAKAKDDQYSAMSNIVPLQNESLEQVRAIAKEEKDLAEAEKKRAEDAQKAKDEQAARDLEDVEQARRKQENDAQAAFANIDKLRSEDQSRAFAAQEEQQRILAQQSQDYARAVMSDIEASFNAIQSVANAVNAIGNRQLQDELDRIDEATQAKLEAAGVEEETTIEKLQRERAEAIADGKKAIAEEKRKEIEKLEILKEADRERAEAQYKAAHAQWEINGWLVAAQSALGVANAWASFPLNPFTIGAAVAAGIAAVASHVAAEPKPPRLADGGIIMPRAGGTTVNVAEAGEAEAVLPLSKLGNYVNSPGRLGGDTGGDIRLVVNVDSKPILETIFPATKNRTVLIDSGAVV